MKSNIILSNQRGLGLFFLITFAWTWLLQLPRLLVAAGWFSLPTGISTGLGAAAVFGPGLAAFGLTWLQSGKDGLYTWLHNRTGGSVLIAGLFHATGNLSGALIPSWAIPLGRWIGLLPLLAAAVLVVWAGGLRRV